jgi:pilus assembly protein CpaF
LVCLFRGSGKTTLLAALLGQVPATERIVCVEDAGELQPNHPQVVRLVARPPNIEGVGEVTVRELVRQALRMRPDRLVVGEVRGAEVCELLTALNTGHDGGAGTLHANSPAEVPARLEALAALGGLSRPALHSQAGAALRVILHVNREPDGTRKLAEIGVVQREAQEIQVIPAWRPTTRLAGWPLLAGLLGQRDPQAKTRRPASLRPPGPQEEREVPADQHDRAPAIAYDRIPANHCAGSIVNQRDGAPW